jgi:hypothetical protein
MSSTAKDKKMSPASLNRPKTSRKKPIPSPEEFADYVVPSPDPSIHDESAVHVVQVHNEVASNRRLVDEIGHSSTPSTNDYDHVIRLGCWLFGAGLKA